VPGSIPDQGAHPSVRLLVAVAAARRSGPPNAALTPHPRERFLGHFFGQGAIARRGVGKPVDPGLLTTDEYHHCPLLPDGHSSEKCLIRLVGVGDVVLSHPK
jgi:hypothetical protein